MGKVLTNGDFLKRLDEKNAYFHNRQFSVIGEYNGMRSPIECECPLHGKWIIGEAHDLVKGSGCPVCAKENRRISNTKTTKRFLEELYEKNSHYRNGEFEVIGEYVNSEIPIECRCPIHGIWKTSIPSSLLCTNGSCPKCGRDKVKTILSRSLVKFLNELKECNAHYCNDEFKVIGEYINSNTPIDCECPIHGIWRTSRPSDLLHGGGCPKCAGVGKMTTEEFLEKLKEKNTHFQNGEFVVVGKYISSQTPIACECPIHGIWTTSRPNNLLNENLGCPKCYNTSTSFAENYIRSALQIALPDAEIPDKGDRKLLEGLEIDIPVYKYGFAVEFGAWHWHKDKIQDDLVKQELLLEKGIKLLTIYDSCDASTGLPKLGKDFQMFLFDLAQEKNWTTLQSIILNILKEYSLNHVEIDWELVRQRAIALSSIKTTKRFLTELYEKNSHYRNGEFEVTGEYVNSQVPIECRCPVHGIWKTSSPSSLLGRNGSCPKCGGKNKTTADFLNKLCERNENYRNGEFVVIGEYKSAYEAIECECPVHGIWRTTPNALFKGVGCKRCSYLKRANARITPKEKFLMTLFEKNKSFREGKFTVIGDYKRSNIPIECECHIHGIWNTTTPSSLLMGRGCPKCGNSRKEKNNG